MIWKFSRWIKGKSDSSPDAPVENSLSDNEALSLKPLSKGQDKESGGDVIFVHGLGGDLYGTWAVSEGGEKVHWARWLAETRPDLSFWTLGYPASPSLWTGRAMPLQDRAVNVLALLKANGIGKRPVCFITHSLGGLLVKQMLRAAISSGTEEYTQIGKSARGVVFLSTPHTGSDLATLVNYLKLILRTSVAIEDLRDNGALLRDLNSWYINHVEKLGIMSKVFFETRPTFGQTIVDESSAALFVKGVTPIGIDANHIEVCKPLSRESLVYKVTRGFVDEVIPLPKREDRRVPTRSLKIQKSVFRDRGEKKETNRNISPPVSDVVYRAWLRDSADAIDIRGIAYRKNQEAARFPLLDLYTDLHVRVSEEESTESGAPRNRETLTNLVERAPRVVIFGDPGSGKTTFLQYLARTHVDDLSRLPLLLRVTDLFKYYIDSQRNDPPSFLPSWRWLIDYWLQQSRIGGWGFTEPWLLDQFKQGRVWMLLDGLDELPNQDSREKMVRILESAAQEWSACHWILTSRPGVLFGLANPLDFSHCEIGALEDAEIRNFLGAWANLLFYSRSPENIAGFQADEYTTTLFRAIRDHQDLRELARNPLMLTSVAVIHWNQKKLPEGRAELYEAVVNWLIGARRELPHRKGERITRQCYQLLALEMFRHPEGRQVQVGLLWAAEKIAAYFDGETREKQISEAQRFLEQEEIDTGILIRRGEGNLAFRHLSFQEYLAACEIASKTDDADDGWWSLIKDELFNPAWYEMLRFFPGRLLTLGDPRVDLFVRRVLVGCRDASLTETARVVGFLGRTLLDLAAYKYSVDKLEEYIRARDQVMQIFSRKDLPLNLQTRYEAAVALGRGGDPRFFDPEKNWVRIPGGMLFVGSQNSDPSQPNYDEFADLSEQPVRQVYTGSFEIGRFLVTVQEYARFLEDDGYQNRSLWDIVGWEWRSKTDTSYPWNWDKQRSILSHM